jgi:hypothetical protein
MRAFGYTAAPALLVISGLDLALHLGSFGGSYRESFGGPEIYTCVLGVVLVFHFAYLAVALARTHRVSLLRAMTTALLPILFFAGVTLGRASLELERFPFVAPPQPSPYQPIIIE